MKDRIWWLRLAFRRFVALPGLVGNIAHDLHKLVEWVRAHEAKASLRTVVVIWCAKRVGESHWRTECQWEDVRLGTVQRFDLSSAAWFGGGRIECGSMITVLNGFARRAILGQCLVGGGNSMTLPDLLEPGMSLVLEVQPL